MSAVGAHSVLALRALGLGDALTGVAALRGLRRAYPDARLVLAGPAGPGHLLQQAGVVDAVLPTEGVRALPEDAVLDAVATSPEVLGGRPVDVAVNLHGRGPQSVRALQALLAAHGSPDGRLVAFACPEAGLDAGPAWDDDEPEVARWCRLVQGAGGECGPEDLRLRLRDPASRGPGGACHDDACHHDARHHDVVLHPGAASGSRRWPVGRWAVLAAQLARAGRRVLLSGGPAERPLTDAVTGLALADGVGGGRVEDLAGRCSLPELATVVGSASLLVCGDTGVAHLGTALGTPSVLLFGPTPPRTWGPAVDQGLHRVLWPAPTADYRGDPHGRDVDPVLAAVQVEDVLDAVRALPGRQDRC